MKKNKQRHNIAWFVLNTLAASICLVNTAHALQRLDDQAMRQVNGQDGVHISTSYDEINVEQLYWEDSAGVGSTDRSSNTLKATANGLKIQQTNANVDNLAIENQTPGTDYKINIGSDPSTGKSGLDLELNLTPTLITVDDFNICDSGERCSDSIGNMAIQTSSIIGANFKTRDGLFSKTTQASLELGLKNANIYLGQTDVTGQLNQLILKNFNFNFFGKGVMFVDATDGFKLQTNADGAGKAVLASDGSGTVPDAQHGYVDFTRVGDTATGVTVGSYAKGQENAGLNLEFMLNQVTSENKDQPYQLDPTTNSPESARGLIRVGASGRMVNGTLQLRGVGSDEGAILGKTSQGTDIMGSTGIGFRMAAEFTQKDDPMLGSDGDATTLEIGGAGLNAYGVEFGNLTGLQPNTRGSFDSGHVYINLADTDQVLLPQFESHTIPLTSSDDYIQKIYTDALNGLGEGQNPYSLLLAIRGAEFQAISRSGRFTNSARTNDVIGQAVPNIAEHTNNEWGLALPFYNLNANMAIYGTKVDATTAYAYTPNYHGNTDGKNQIGMSGETSRLGLSLAMSTQGVSDDGQKTTSIMVIDGGDGNMDQAGIQPTNYYIGLRNIDLLLKGTGSIGIEQGSLNVSLKDLLMAMSAQIAAGYLPGSTYKCSVATDAGCLTAFKGKTVGTDFGNNDDVLFGINLRAGGDMNLSLIPNNEYKADGTGSRINIVGDFSLDPNQRNAIQIADPNDGSMIGLDNLQGALAFNNAIVIAPKDNVNGAEGIVNFNTEFTFNPQHIPEGVFRARDINLYPPNASSTSGARLGEMAITGGRLSSQFGIMPRN